MAITLILLLCMLVILKKYRLTSNKKLLFHLPLITLLQINIHGAFFLYDFVFLLPFVFFTEFPKAKKIKSQLVSWWKNNKDILLMVPFMVLSGCVNLNGPKAMFWLFSSNISVMRGFVTELKSEYFSFGLAICFTLILLCGVCYLENGKTDMSVVCLLGGSAIMCIVFFRNEYFLPLAFSCGVGYCSSVLIPNPSLVLVKKEAQKKVICIGLALLVFVSASAAALFSRQNVPPELNSIRIVAEQLKKEDYSGSVFCNTDIGSILNFYGVKTLTNCMPEASCESMNKSAPILEDFGDVHDIESLNSFFEKYNVEFYVVDNKRFGQYDLACIKQFVSEHHWNIYMEDDNCVVYKRPTQ